MKLGDFLGKRFGRLQTTGGEQRAAAQHNGYEIHPSPRSEGGRYYVAGVIKKTFPEGAREYSFVRADTFSSAAEAAAFTIVKARRIIDEQGDRIFGEQISP